jgi:hypothetical protein
MSAQARFGDGPAPEPVSRHSTPSTEREPRATGLDDSWICRQPVPAQQH